MPSRGDMRRHYYSFSPPCPPRLQPGQYGGRECHPSAGVSPLGSQLAQPGQLSTSKQASPELHRGQILQDRPHIQTPE